MAKCKECGELEFLGHKCEKDELLASPVERRVMDEINKAAQSLFDNRLGWGNGRSPYAPRSFWADLGAALYGEDDSRVKELREEKRP